MALFAVSQDTDLLAGGRLAAGDGLAGARPARPVHRHPGDHPRPRTASGRCSWPVPTSAALGFDDPMEIVSWQPPADGRPGKARIEKRGTVMTGWAELTVEPRGTGSRSTWREDIDVARLPRFAAGPTRLSSRLLFGRVLRKLLTD